LLDADIQHGSEILVRSVEPGHRTGIHHHEEQHAVVYVFSGSSYIRWGERGEFDATAQAGDFLYVPAWLPHQEIIPSSEVPFKWVVVRSTSEPIVLNLPDDFWGWVRTVGDLIA
jgi:uncharacterized RmlC-like cupin family protein